MAPNELTRLLNGNYINLRLPNAIKANESSIKYIVFGADTFTAYEPETVTVGLLFRFPEKRIELFPLLSKVRNL